MRDITNSKIAKLEGVLILRIFYFIKHRRYFDGVFFCIYEYITA